MPVMLNPVRNLNTANITKEVEKALTNAKPIPATYEINSIGLRPYLQNENELVSLQLL